MAPGEGLAVGGDGGEVGCEFLEDCQCLVILGLRLRPLPTPRMKEPQVEVALGHFLAIHGYSEELCREILSDRQSLARLGLRLCPHAEVFKQRPQVVVNRG